MSILKELNTFYLIKDKKEKGKKGKYIPKSKKKGNQLKKEKFNKCTPCLLIVVVQVKFLMV